MLEAPNPNPKSLSQAEESASAYSRIQKKNYKRVPKSVQKQKYITLFFDARVFHFAMRVSVRKEERKGYTSRRKH